MPGTSTVGDVSVVAANASSVTLHLIDASGDLFTDSIQSTSAPTLAQIQEWKTQYQAASNASLWKVTSTSEWFGEQDPDNALALYRASVKDGINLLFKNATTLDATTPRLIAPIDAVMQGNQDIPLLTGAPMPLLIAAYQAILAGYALESAQFTERRERSNNPRIKA